VLLAIDQRIRYVEIGRPRPALRMACLEYARESTGVSVLWDQDTLRLHVHNPGDDETERQFYSKTIQGTSRAVWVHFPVAEEETVTEIWTREDWAAKQRELVVSWHSLGNLGLFAYLDR
jgi:hypothetical protein